MKSPFPGMDPYLEEHWRDIHHSFLTYARDEMQGYLPKELRARLEERVYVEPESDQGRGIYPDVRVVEYPKPGGDGGGGGTAVAVEVETAPAVVIEMEYESVTEGSIEIVDASSGNRVVTAVELLSDSNKLTNHGRKQYRKKQREYLDGDVNLVEIDLLRSGKRIMAVAQHRVPSMHRSLYQVCVTRCAAGKHEVYPVRLQEPLPTIRVPLRPTDPDVPLNLQVLIERCYHNGRYDDINYRVDPIPLLAPVDAAWADGLLKEKGMR